MLFSSRKDSLTLIIDLQSSVVRGSLIWVRPGLPPHVLYTYGKGIAYRPDGGSQYLIKAALHNISETIEAVLRFHSIALQEEVGSLPPALKDVHYVLSSPWAISQAKNLSSTFHRSTVLDDAVIKEILATERAKIITDDASDTAIVEEKIFDVRLNGYSVQEWHNRSTTELGVSYVISSSGKKMITKLREACKHVVKDSHVYFHSSLLLQYIGFRTLMPEKSAYTLVHVHGELTDIVVVNNATCVFFGSYPMGVHTIIRKIAYAMKTDTHAADSLLSMYIAHHLDPLPQKNVLPVMDDMAQGWIGEFKKLFKDVGADITNHSHVIISSRSHEDFFSTSFKRAYPTSDITELSVEDIGTKVTFSSTAEQKPLLGVYTFAIHSIGKNNNMI